MKVGDLLIPNDYLRRNGDGNLFGIILEEVKESPMSLTRYKVLLTNGITHWKVGLEIRDFWEVEECRSET